MLKKRSIQSIVDDLKSKKAINILAVLLFAFLFTLTLSLRYFLFQNIVNEDSTSKKDIYAPRAITVVDTYKTELQKKAAVQKVDPVLMLAEDSYIKNDLQMLVASIERIRSKKIAYNDKAAEYDNLFDMVSPSQKNILKNYFLNATLESIDATFTRVTEDLNSVLEKIHISDTDFDTASVNSIIYNYIGTGTKGKTAEARVVAGIMEQVIVPNIVINEQATKMARKNAEDAIQPYTKTFQKGDKILYEGQPVNKFERAVLKEAGYNVLDLNYQAFIGLLAIVSLSIMAFLYYLYFFEKPYFNRNHLMIVGMLALVMAILATVRPDELSIYILPLQMFTILIAVLTNPRISFVATFILLAIISLAFLMPAKFLVVFSLVSLFITISIAKIKYAKRFDLAKIGIETSVVMVFLILSIFALEKGLMDIEMNQVLLDLITAAVVCFGSGILALGLMPLFESVFKIITPYELTELGDQNQPLLKRLQLEAPGTFAHSTMVANLAEAAAEAIHADPILARVGALYHDIGKLKRPLFFIENQPFFGIENPHSKINPRLSKMVVTAHPKDGSELAKDHGLPVIIQDMILQHHGDSLASYFYAEALKKEGEENIQEEQFRYNGPKPAMKETAILMIADAVEAAARTLHENYTQEELEALINKIIKERLNDGQLSDSPLTLKDLKIIAGTFNRILRAAHHQRIKYHEDIIKELKTRTQEQSSKPQE